MAASNCHHAAKVKAKTSCGGGFRHRKKPSANAMANTAKH
jgi:hypothetical protein